LQNDEGRLSSRPFCFCAPNLRSNSNIVLAAYSVSSEVGTGSREENASEQKIRASVLLQSEPKRLWRSMRRFAVARNSSRFHFDKALLRRAIRGATPREGVMPLPEDFSR
jgi:hypothetical protein